MTADLITSSKTPEIAPFWERFIVWEIVVWIAVTASYVSVISLGSENGIGYFHQPHNGLLAPLVMGGMINAALFVANASYAIPKFLATGRWRQYLGVIIGLCAASVIAQTLVQVIIIQISEPDMATIGWAALGIDNILFSPFVIVFSALYKFSRDWVFNATERRKLQSRNERLEHRLEEAQDEMRILGNAGAMSDSLQFSSGTEKHQIAINSIQYIKSAGNYVEIITGERTYLAYGALKDIKRQLPQKRFAQIHRSFLIGLEHIRMIKGDMAYLSKAEIPIGAVYKNAFLEEWARRAVAHVDTG